jgi:hypothetical protein
MAENIDYNTQFSNSEFWKYNEEIEALRAKYRVQYTFTKEDERENPSFKEGAITSKNPHIPNTPKEAFELFKNYYAAIQLSVQKNLFIDKYRIWNESSMKAELSVIDEWISIAEKLNYADCFSHQGGPINTHIDAYEYLRLKNGFYEGYLMTWEQHSDMSTTAMVYGRYFLFRSYLLDKLYEINGFCNVPWIHDVTNSDFQIGKEILFDLYSLSQQPTQALDSYIGDIWRYDAPFGINVYGAYPLIEDWKLIEYKMTLTEDESGYFKNYTKEKVYSAMKEYAKGFQIGFDSFFVNIQKQKMLDILSLDAKVAAIISVISNPFNKPGFTSTHGNNVDEFSNWHNDGVKAGAFYFCWYFIVSNHRLFESYFKERIKLNNTHKDYIAALSENTKLIQAYFECLSGKWRNVEIMNNNEYKRFISYAEYTFTNSQLPPTIEPVKKGNSQMPELFLRHTIYLFWKKELKGDKKNPQKLWIDFYKKVFAPYCKNLRGDLSKNFSKPPSNNYEQDKGAITFYEPEIQE